MTTAPHSEPATDSSVDPRWQPALDHSRFLRQLLAAHPEFMPVLRRTWEQPIDGDEMEAFLADPPPADEEELRGRLRRLRQRTMAQLILRDLTGLAPLAEVVETMTRLADATTNFAADFLHRRLAAQYGEPLDTAGRPQRLIVVGMGKLGGRELNVSSDVDYIFIYPEDGETAGRADGSGRIDAYDFFVRLGKRLIATLGEITADGQVFRVDMRLRPNGDSGPLVCSLDALENYFITQGREWERYAWIKARPMNAGANADGPMLRWIAALGAISRPFVFRKYLDFGAINAMRDLHAQIRREVARKDMADHVKLGPGGIREIEFIAQVFQLIRGGRDTALQVRPTLEVLSRATERRLIPPDARQELANAYDFLRRLEHRLQYLDDCQTHSLPGNAEDQARVAASMGFPDYPAMLAVLDGHRARVSRHFEQVFSDPEDGEHALTGIWLGQIDEAVAVGRLAGIGFSAPADALARLQRLRDSGRYQQLATTSRERLDAVGPRLIEAAAATPNPDATLSRGLDFLESIGRRGAYLALLQQYPQALRKVADLVGSSSWAAEYLTKHPILLDELLDPRLLDVATDWAAFRADLGQNLSLHADDSERQMDILREMHHGQVFRLLAQDLAGLHTIERISDHLTELADIIVATTLDLCWQKLRHRHRDKPAFAVIGYGKLGGKELGYASDLDLVFLYDDPAPEAPEIYARLAQRLNTWLSSQTPAGLLFETDFRLRPNGDSGLLVTSVQAFREYQLERAWVWEHQALTRARFCAGDTEVGRQFEAIRDEVLRRERDLGKLRTEVLDMRAKMLDAHASGSETQFDIKQDPGGIIDVEFIVQYLVLGHAHRHPELTGNLGNIALLGIAAQLGLIPADLADGARNAYREYRRLQHAKRLNATPKARADRDTVAAEIDAVRGLWRAVFGAG